MEFWDVSAVKKHRDLVKYAIAKSHCYMICFNQIDFKSFKSVSETWIHMLNDTQRASALLVGTKTDLLLDDDIMQQLKQYDI